MIRVSQTLSAIVAGCFVAPAAGHAQQGYRSAPRADTSLWELPSESTTKYHTQLELGDALATSAIEHWSRNRRRAIQLASLAIDAYHSAATLVATTGEPHYRIAKVILAFLTRRNTPSPLYLKQEIAQYTLFMKKAPLDSRIPRVLFRRAVARTKLMDLKNLEAAVIDYDRYLALADHSNRDTHDITATSISNRAEVLMMLGRLPEAITEYELALEYHDNPLTGYGLAVALDRDGHKTRAQQVARHYSRLDSNDRLHHASVFFVPHGEVNYYFAIQAEARDKPKVAAKAYRKFLQLVPNSRWAPKARENLNALVSNSTKRRPRNKS